MHLLSSLPQRPSLLAEVRGGRRRRWRSFFLWIRSVNPRAGANKQGNTKSEAAKGKGKRIEGHTPSTGRNSPPTHFSQRGALIDPNLFANLRTPVPAALDTLPSGV
jgi:hypothetical protein